MSPLFDHAQPSAAPVLRTEDDEDADREEYMKNLARQAYKEWPNEAGFDGLTEEKGPVELVVKGEIPSWAAGTLYRTGPGASKIEGTPKGTFYVSHWFDGFAHTHKFDILQPEDGTSGCARAVYTSRHQSDWLVQDIRAHGQNKSYYTFGQRRDPCLGLFSKIMSVFKQPPEPSYNVSVVVQTNMPGLASQAKETKNEGAAQGHRRTINNVWVTTDSSPMVQMDADTLEPIGRARQTALHPDLRGPGSCAHAHRDPETGDFFNYNLELGKTPVYRIFRVSAASGKTEILATITNVAKPAYIHSFFLTPSFVVLCVPTAHYALNGLMIPWVKNLLDSIDDFNSTKPCKWLVVDRHGGKGLVAIFETPAAFFFHSVNSFEETTAEGTDVICELVEYPNQDILRSFYYDVLLNREGAADTFLAKEGRAAAIQPRLARYRLRVPSTSPGTCGRADSDGIGAPTEGQAELLSFVPAPHVGELPTINPAYHCKRHRYVYGTGNRGHSLLVDCIVKTDADMREALVWTPPHAHTPGEAIFVPRPATREGEALAEDDGVLLSVVLDGTAQRSYLLCLDARTLKELGRAECPFAVGFGFHGVHTPHGI